MKQDRFFEKDKGVKIERERKRERERVEMSEHENDQKKIKGWTQIVVERSLTFSPFIT